MRGGEGDGEESTQAGGRGSQEEEASAGGGGITLGGVLCLVVGESGVDKQQFEIWEVVIEAPPPSHKHTCTQHTPYEFLFSVLILLLLLGLALALSLTLALAFAVGVIHPPWESSEGV